MFIPTTKKKKAIFFFTHLWLILCLEQSQKKQVHYVLSFFDFLWTCSMFLYLWNLKIKICGCKYISLLVPHKYLDNNMLLLCKYELKWDHSNSFHNSLMHGNYYSLQAWIKLGSKWRHLIVPVISVIQRGESPGFKIYFITLYLHQ